MANPSWLDKVFATPETEISYSGPLEKGDIVCPLANGTWLLSLGTNLTTYLTFPAGIVTSILDSSRAVIQTNGFVMPSVSGLLPSTGVSYVRLNLDTGKPERILADPSGDDWPIGKATGGGILLLQFEGTTGQLIVPAPDLLDFTSLAGSYSGATFQRSASSVYVMRSTSTVEGVSSANSPLWEDRGDGAGGGVWTFPAYTNAVADPFDISSGAWTPYVTGTITANALTSPSGSLTADQFTEASAVAGPGAVYQAFGSAAAWSSVWVTDSGTAPTHPGMLTAVSSASRGATFSVSGWRRVSTYEAASDIFALWGPGKAPGPVDTAAATGTYYWWGSSRVAGKMDLPLAATSSGACTIALDHTKTIVDGNFDFEVSFVIHHLDCSDWSGDFHIFQGTSADGDLSLRYVNSTNSFVLAARGADVLTVSPSDAPNTNTNLNWRMGDTITIRAWYRPGTASAGVRYTVNGVTGADKTGAASGLALAALTAFSLGAIGGTPLAARFRNARVMTSPVSTKPVEIVVLGDSTIAAYALQSSSAEYYSAAQRTSRPGIGMIALPGDTIALQKAKLLASPWYGFTGVDAVVIEVGINDCTATSVNATVIAAYQDLVNTAALGFPGAQIVVAQMSPAKAYYTAVYGGGAVNAYATWQALNTAIASTITGVSARVTSHDAILNDGSGNINAAYSIGDGVHPNNAGRAVIASAHRAALVSLGVLT